MALLRNNSQMAGQMVVRKLSTHHDGVREVYLTKCLKIFDGQTEDMPDHNGVLTVFNLESERYAPMKEDARKRMPDFIDEVRFIKTHKGLKGIPQYVSSGICRHNGQRLAWMVQKWVAGNTMDANAMLSDQLAPMLIPDPLGLFHTVANVLEMVARFTGGGGHYNICPDNVLLTIDGNELKDVNVIGFSNIGPTYGGNAPIDVAELDPQFAAPEMAKGIFNYRSDIY
ncbi:MAG: hypothetical protein K2K97_06855, partial [Muribaculaceae bacterium]|nr:hypothetical protein [Muribaculaceae bacterium]